MNETANTTEKEILLAAKKIFKSRGYESATVQEIATEANTTKSMVNYYFRSKEKLFTSVFLEEFRLFFYGIANTLQSDLPLKDKINEIVNLDTQKFLEYPELPLFILNEINRNTEMVFTAIAEFKPSGIMESLQKQIDKAARNGEIKKVKAEDLLLNIQSLTIFPYLAKPLMKKMFDLNEEKYHKKIQQRKQMIADILWSYLTD